MNIQCSYCRNYPRELFFSHYVLKMVSIGEDEILPKFCGVECMIKYVSDRLGKNFFDIKEDYSNFTR